MKKVESPTIIHAEGNKPKIIEEYIGRVNTSVAELSVARMQSPEGWEEPGQTPEFDEYSLVLKGTLRVRTRDEVLDIEERQAVIVPAGEWVQYSTPFKDGAEYVAVCLPAFSQDIVHRDE